MTDDLIARLRGHASYIEDGAYENPFKDAADALEAQGRRIAELEAGEPACFPEWLEAKNAHIAELTAALRPFADEADGLWDEEHDDEIYDITVKSSDLRAARAALEKKDD